MSVILFIETSTTITAYSHSQKTHSQDVRKDVRYQSVSQSINQTVLVNQINQISQSIDQSTSVIQTLTSVIHISLRQFQSLYSQLSYNSLYAAINQSYHSYNQSSYESINQYASLESPRSSYVSNQIRFIPQVSQSNLFQSIQSSASASQSSQSSQLSSSASASQFASELIQFHQSYTSNN